MNLICKITKNISNKNRRESATDTQPENSSQIKIALVIIKLEFRRKLAKSCKCIEKIWNSGMVKGIKIK